ncbi:MAG: transposase [Chloroflexi bacterium]|nr:transposase [Chloroflexota bacterium]
MPPDRKTARRFRPIIPGATYFVTSVAYLRQRWFAYPAFSQIVVDQLNYYRKLYQFDLPAFAVLPDHYHIVITPGTEKNISQILHAIHSYSATLINQQLGIKKRSRSGREILGMMLRVTKACIGG